ncbi:MAG: PorV/PorQ family protein [Flavobacteriales bacterium]|nr:PorV/PorQ family protein [Bacteroidota bacterium]MCB9241333.1 PorV/PorQ family protein [Flavobacteriales bacterium]
MNVANNMRISLTAALISAVGLFSAQAGNPDRIGQAGATQLLINPFAKTSGMGWAGVSSVRGLESTFLNVGGLAYSKTTELGFSNTNWLVGSDIQINAFGFSQSLGGEGVLAMTVMTTNLGEIDVTTVEQPEGGLGTINPKLTNIGIAYAKRFTQSISGGVLVRIHSEAIPNAKTQGIALDAGIQYTETSDKSDKLKKDDIKFGISLKNVGPDASYSGDGVTFKAQNPNNDVQQSYLWRTASFGLPTLINIGASYDFRMDKTTETYYHRLTTALNFTSNAYTRNQFTAGLEYGFKELFMLRAAFAYEDGILDANKRTTAYNGLTGGFSLELPMSKSSDNAFGIDYSYRHSNPFSGTHAVGVRILID